MATHAHFFFLKFSRCFSLILFSIHSHTHTHTHARTHTHTHTHTHSLSLSLSLLPNEVYFSTLSTMQSAYFFFPHCCSAWISWVKTFQQQIWHNHINLSANELFSSSSYLSIYLSPFVKFNNLKRLSFFLFLPGSNILMTKLLWKGV